MILMDLQMPEMNGFEAVQNIRHDESNRNFKIGFCTAGHLEHSTYGSTVLGIKIVASNPEFR